MNGTSGVGLERKIEEYQARERVYRAGLLEQDAQANQLRSMASDVVAAYGDVSRAAVRGSLSDPSQNMEVLLLRQKAREKDEQIRHLREELEANRFDQQMPAGRALMRKCKALLDENRELGDQITEARTAELRAAVQAEQKQTAELEIKFKESVEFTKELQMENEKLQVTLAKVAGKLRSARGQLQTVHRERVEAKSKKKREREELKAAIASAIAPTGDGIVVTKDADAATSAVAPHVSPKAVLKSRDAAEAAAASAANGEKEKKRKKADKEKDDKKPKKSK